MASLTIKERLDRLDAYLNRYLPMQKVPQQFLIKKIERSRNHIWRSIILDRDFLFRKLAVAASDDDYPADWVSYANNAYYTVGGAQVPFAFINIQEIGSALKNRYSLGTTTTPKIYFSDHKIRTLPTGLSAITIEYVSQPVELDGAPLTTTDEMPADTEDMIIRGAFERVLGQLRNDRDMLELAGLQNEDVQRATQQYYHDYYQKNLMGGGDIEVPGA